MEKKFPLFTVLFLFLFVHLAASETTTRSSHDTTEGTLYEDYYGDYGDYIDQFTLAPPLVRYSGKFGKLCRHEDDCGPYEICRKNPRFRPMALGHCDCRRCYGYDMDDKLCVPLTIMSKVCNRTISFELLKTTTTPRLTTTKNETDYYYDGDISFWSNVTSTKSPLKVVPKRRHPLEIRNMTTGEFLVETCDNTCDPMSRTELYPKHAQCLSDGRLVCSNCYYASRANDACLPLPTTTANLAQGQVCQNDCACKTGLKCRPTCGCPPGFRWDSGEAQCVDIVFGYGDKCQTDAECALNGANPRLRFAPPSGVKCVLHLNNNAGGDYEDYGDYEEEDTESLRNLITTTTQKTVKIVPRRRHPTPKPSNATEENVTRVFPVCECAPGYVDTYLTFVNPDTGRLAAKRICVTENSAVVNKGATCHLDPIEAGLAAFGGNNESVVCDTRSTCFQCPEGFMARGFGRCRVVQTFTDLQRWHNSRLVWTKWTGSVCTQDSDCHRRNEICLKQPVEPPCQQGYCACRANYGYGYNGDCLPVRRFNVGSPCNATEDELYPSNAHCSRRFGISTGIVACNLQFKKKGKECVRDTFSYVGYGSVCVDNNCASGLICGVARKQTCECPSTSQFWNSTASSCMTRLLGSRCRADAECDASDPPRKRKPGGRICASRPAGGLRCSCDPAFSAAECYLPRTVDLFNDWDTMETTHNDDDYFYPNQEKYNYCNAYFEHRLNFSDYFEVNGGVTLVVPTSSTQDNTYWGPFNSDNLIVGSSPSIRQNNFNISIYCYLTVLIILFFKN